MICCMFIEMIIAVFDSVWNIVGKGENVGYLKLSSFGSQRTLFFC